LLLVRKSIKQSYIPSTEVFSLMQEYRRMTNDAIRIGIANNNLSNLMKLSKLAYKELKRYKDVPSCYKLCAISKAAEILTSRKKSIKRGFPTKDPYVKTPLLVSCYRFKLVNGKLRIPIAKRKTECIPLNNHILKILESDKTHVVRSFTLTERSLSLCIAKQVSEIVDIKSAVGIDRNLRNLCVGNQSKVSYYDMSKVVKIGETTKDIVRSFKRNDIRIRKKIASKYGNRKKNRVQYILNGVSKDVVQRAYEEKSVIIFEDIRYIRSMYRRGNFQGRHYRRQMNNNWHYGEIKRQVVYKAQWKGVPIIYLTKSETRGTSSNCYICGERLQSSRDKPRQLWCQKCGRWFDRDMVAVMNISHRGWMRFAQSQYKGIGSEAMVQERERRDEPLILKVDPMKLCQGGREIL
jgi:putative transposase